LFLVVSDRKNDTHSKTHSHRNRHHLGRRIQYALPWLRSGYGLAQKCTGFFQRIFPWFQKNIPKGYVCQQVAGDRVAQVVCDSAFSLSGVHWSWDNRNSEINAPFFQALSKKANDPNRSSRLWDLTGKLIGCDEGNSAH
jgi:hypothetical protein